MKSRFFLAKSEKGTALLEFAMVFPLLFFVCFMTLLYLFWMGDAMIQSHISFRANQAIVKQVPVFQNESNLSVLGLAPSLNLFQEVSFTQNSLAFDAQNFLVITETSFSNPLLPTRWLRLSLLGDINNQDNFTMLRSSAVGIREPYLPGNGS
jgi:hypothetical protein